jgi:hypothetical protein
MEGMSGNIAAYPIISLIIFVSFFVSMLLWVISLSRDHVRHMSQLPLENEPGDQRHE